MVLYRILESLIPERGWARYGVAYTHDGRVLLFVPMWRSPRILPVHILSDLDEKHVPSGPYPFRWSEQLHEWREGDDLFHPMKAITGTLSPVSTLAMLTQKLEGMHEYEIDALIISFLKRKPWDAVRRTPLKVKINDFVEWAQQEKVLNQAYERAQTQYPFNAASKVGNSHMSGVPIQQIHEKLRQATFRIKIPEEDGVYWGTGFFITPNGLALTAYHNLPRYIESQGKGKVDVYYRDTKKPLSLLWRADLSNKDVDIAVLELPDSQPFSIGYLTPAYLNLGLPSHQRRQFWAGRSVCVYGFPCEEGVNGERRVDGLIDAGQPLAWVDEDDEDKNLIRIERLRILGVPIEQLPGISGGPVFDRESGLVIGVDGAALRPMKHRAWILASELASLVEQWPADLMSLVQDLTTGSAQPTSCRVPSYKIGYRPLLDVPVTNNLPLHLTSFVGREKETDQVKSLLEKTRLLTLTGSGGCGKTRLSLQVAADLLEMYPDGVWQIELAALTDPAFIEQTLASVLGQREQQGQSLLQTLITTLHAKTTLLLLDNCEHLLAGCARLADALLRACPHLELLATSREALNISGETVWCVPSLALPDAAVLPTEEKELVSELLSYDAVRLFADRARSKRPDFALTLQNGSVVAEICRRLDGIPLAIELAAARVRSLSVVEIHARLDQRFRLLTGGSRTALKRQQTLQALIDWSYDMLNGQEQKLLGRLSVFAGGWTLKAAEKVCSGEAIEDSTVLDLLTALTDKSLVVFEEQEGEGRYSLLETMRQYAQDRLVETGEAEVVWKRHLDYFLNIAETASRALRGEGSAYWYAMLESEHDNLRSALDYCHKDPTSAESGLRMTTALEKFWREHGYWSEGRQRIEKALSHADKSPTTIRGIALCTAGRVAELQGHRNIAMKYYEESLAILKERSDQREMAYVFVCMGILKYSQGKYEQAISFLEQSRSIDLAQPTKKHLASTLFHLGRVLKAQHKYDEAYQLLKEAHNLDLAFHEHCGNARFALGDAERRKGNYIEACTLLSEGLTHAVNLGMKIQTNWALELLALLAQTQSQYARAARLCGAADELRKKLGRSLAPDEQADYDHSVSETRQALGVEIFEKIRTEGSVMTPDEVVKYALKC